MRIKSPVLRIAMTHLLSKKRQTLVATLGVTFGSMIFIFQAGLMTGFQSTFIDQTINTTANIHIYNEPDRHRPSLLERFGMDSGQVIMVSNQKPKDELNKIRNGYQIISLLEKHPDVEGVSPFLGSQAILRAGIVQFGGRIAGIDVEKEDIVFHVSDYMVQGDLRRLSTLNNAIILGEGLADNLGVKLNDNVTLLAPNGTTLDMKVVGINRTGLTELDRSRAYISIRNAQILLGVDNSYITDINVKLKDIDKAPALSAEFQERFGYKAEDWKTANANIFGVFKIQNMVTYLIIASILIVSGFGIFNILMMIIYEKMTDIAILKAIGYKDRDIRLLFVAESLTIGIVGGLLGLAAGFMLTRIVGSIPLNIKGFVTMEYLKFNSSPLFYIVAFTFALVATALAGYFPARKAASVDPVDIIRSK
jgi:lipoprotein-releasing system permease protein